MRKLYSPCALNFLSGSTIAKNRSLDNAVNVKTDTPIDTSFTNSDIIHIDSPHGHEATVYTIETNGTVVIITNKSAKASDKMYLKRGEQINNFK